MYLCMIYTLINFVFRKSCIRYFCKNLKTHIEILKTLNFKINSKLIEKLLEVCLFYYLCTSVLGFKRVIINNYNH